MGEGAAMKLAATQLVRRARQGDQNAVGMIVAVRENAKRGAPRARAMMRLLKREVERPRSPARVGSDGSSGERSRADLVMLEVAASPTKELFVPRLEALAVPLGRRRVSMESAARALSMGRVLRPDVLRSLARRLPRRQAEAFAVGWKVPSVPRESRSRAVARYDRLDSAESGAFRLGCALRLASERQRNQRP